MRSTHALAAGLGAILLLGLPMASQATLGGTADSVQSDQIKLKAARQVTSRAAYQVHEMTLASGTVVREYVDGAGSVFGVAWAGPVMPDLNQLLGTSFARLTAASHAGHATHRMLAVHDADLVIESSGRMRAFRGRAYLTGSLPSGVSSADIQ